MICLASGHGLGIPSSTCAVDPMFIDLTARSVGRTLTWIFRWAVPVLRLSLWMLYGHWHGIELENEYCLDDGRIDRLSERQGAATGKIRDIHYSSSHWNHEPGVLVQIRL